MESGKLSALALVSSRGAGAARRRGVTLAACLVLGGCASAEPPATTPPPVAVSRTHAPYTDADVAFMQGMILHHGQALDMSALVPARASDARMPALAERIAVTQRNEIERMSRWLRDRGETVPDPLAYDEHAAGGHGGHGHMPGMLSPAEMQALGAARGPAFDAMWLEYMIRHHEGALTMVAELQAAGGGLEPEIYRFAADVDADQRAEIARMQAMLNDIQRGS